MKFVLTIIVLSLLVNAKTQQPCRVDVPCNGNPRFAEYGNLPVRDERAIMPT